MISRGSHSNGFTPENRKAIESDLREAVESALLAHKRFATPIAVMRNDRVVVIPPEEIPVPEGSHKDYAGNLGDLFKHACLLGLFTRLATSAAGPLHYVETHSGYAGYPLSRLRDEQDKKHQQWRLLLEKGRWQTPALAKLRDYISEHDEYPGSPALALSFLSESWQFLFCDLSSNALRSIENLASELRRSDAVTVSRADGFECVGSRIASFPGSKLLIFVDPFYYPSQRESDDWNGLVGIFEKACDKPNVAVIGWYKRKCQGQKRVFPSAKRMHNLSRLGVQHSEIWFSNGMSGGCGLAWLNLPEMAQITGDVCKELRQQFADEKLEGRKLDLEFARADAE
jgi:23S rRNA A2030 N6-methylase RlmJ